MPLDLGRVTSAAGKVYGMPFVGIAEYPAQIAVNIAALTVNEVDTQGFLKPGVAFTKAGVLPGVAPAYVFGVTPEPLDVLHLLPFSGVTWAAALAAAGTIDIVVITIGQVNRAIIEDNLDRVLTANELAAYVAAGSTIKLLG